MRPGTASGVLGHQLTPFLIRAADYVAHGSSKALRSYIVDDLARLNCGVDGLAAFVEEQLDAGTALILIDGLDEAIDPLYRKQVRDQVESLSRSLPSGCRMVVSSRVAGYLAAQLVDPFVTYIVRPMSITAIEQFLAVYCSFVEVKLGEGTPENRVTQAAAQRNKLLAAIKNSPGVRRLASNPLLLTAMTLIGRNDAELPTERAKFYARVVETLGGSWRAEQTGSMVLESTVLHRILRQLAMHLRSVDPGGTVSGADAKVVLGRLATQRPWVDDAGDDSGQERMFAEFLRSVDEHSGLLVERSEGRFAFTHLTFEEFYAAESLKSNDPAQLRALLHQTRWKEPLLLAFGLMLPEQTEWLVPTALLAQGERAEALGLEPSPYNDLLHRDEVFAARVIADGVTVEADLPEPLFALVAQLMTTGPATIRTPVRTEFTPHLALAQTAPLRDALLSMLTDTDDAVRAGAAGALSGAATEPAVRDALLGMLTDTDDAVRAGAAGALGRAATEPAVRDALLSMLTDTDNTVRYLAVIALSGAATEPAVRDALLGMLTDTDNTVRYFAVNALSGAATEPAVRDALLSMLTDTDNTVRYFAVNALSGAATEPAVRDALLSMLTDTDYTVRYFAVNALSGAATEPAVRDALLSMLSHSDKTVRAGAAGALGGAATEPAVRDALLSMLTDTDDAVRAGAAGALGGAATEPAVRDALLSMLTDTDDVVRAGAVSVLGGAATEPAVRDALLSMLTDTDNVVRAGAVSALGGAATEPAVRDALLSMLTDTDDAVRVEAAEALGGAATEPAVRDTLLSMLTDTDNTVRYYAVHALSSLPPSSDLCERLAGQGRAGSADAISALSDLLQARTTSS